MTRFIKATYHPNIKAAEFIADDGRHLIRSGGSLQWRICNAGDLVSPVINGIPCPKKTKGYIGFAKAANSDHHFFIFPDYETGRAELKTSLQRKYKNKTLSETVKSYAPKHDGNDSDKYVNDLSKMSGVDKNTKIKDLSDTQLSSLMDSIERLEGYHADADTRKEIWLQVSHIQATDGTRPLANEEIVVRMDGKETTLKSNAIGKFPPIVHGTGPAEIHHKTIDGDLKKVGELPADKGQHWSLITKVAEFFGTTAPVKAPDNLITKKQPLHYTVQSGDTLNKIATRLKTNVAQIKKDNHLTKDTILPGQVLGINQPAPVSLGATPAKKATPKSAPSVAEAGAVSANAFKPKRIPTLENQTTFARSKEGAGEPLALITPEDGVAPWMKYALAEAKRFHGSPEQEIEKDINYHKEIKDSMKSMAGKDNAWCAAFANWCLMKAGYPIQNPKETGFVDWSAAKARADGFRQLHGKKESKGQKYDDIPFVPNPLFVKIDEPIYGAIAVITTPSNHGEHVGFVYGRSAKDSVCVLGGNQSDMICFRGFTEKEVIRKTKVKTKTGKIVTAEKKSKHLEFFIPASYFHAYEKMSKSLSNVNPDAANKTIGIEFLKDKAKTT
ncbi:MAG TPA: LysM peptidoglycan-binding domain-containing protein [Burkholderiaceae bacterium]|jgi:LysM repeat protein